MSTVPCNGCVRCCIGDAMRLLEDEEADRYQTVPHPTLPGKRVLAHKIDRSCVYLGPKGCTIQEWKPRLCQEFDCRRVAQVLSFSLARQARIVPIWRKGKDLLRADPTATVDSTWPELPPATA